MGRELHECVLGLGTGFGEKASPGETEKKMATPSELTIARGYISQGDVLIRRQKKDHGQRDGLGTFVQKVGDFGGEKCSRGT